MRVNDFAEGQALTIVNGTTTTNYYNSALGVLKKVSTATTGLLSATTIASSGTVNIQGNGSLEDSTAANWYIAAADGTDEAITVNDSTYDNKLSENYAGIKYVSAVDAVPEAVYATLTYLNNEYTITQEGFYQPTITFTKTLNATDTITVDFATQVIIDPSIATAAQTYTVNSNPYV